MLQYMSMIIHAQVATVSYLFRSPGHIHAQVATVSYLFRSPGHIHAQVAKLVDALPWGGSEATRAGSNPVLGTKYFSLVVLCYLLIYYLLI